MSRRMSPEGTSRKPGKSEARDKKIFDLWLSCHTQEEIAEEVGCDQATTSRICDEFMQKVLENQMHKAAADHATDFDPPLYNIWKFKEKSIGSKHPGNTEATILDNLLYLYTKPFDVVIDPFAGGGSTVPSCHLRHNLFHGDHSPTRPARGRGFFFHASAFEVPLRIDQLLQGFLRFG